MKLQRFKVCEYAGTGKTYFRYSINIPGKAIKTLDWKKGDRLEMTYINGKLILENEE